MLEGNTAVKLRSAASAKAAKAEAEKHSKSQITNIYLRCAHILAPGKPVCPPWGFCPQENNANNKQWCRRRRWRPNPTDPTRLDVDVDVDIATH